MIPSGEKPYLYAMGWRFLTPWYDRLCGRLTPEKEFHGKIIERLAARPGQAVLDVGCGTGTLALKLAGETGAAVTGIDGDPEILAIAAAKLRGSAAPARFIRSDAASLPFPDRSFDAALSSLAFHHLFPDAKRSALREIARVLKPGGRLLLLDFGRPSGRLQRALGAVVGLLENPQAMEDNLEGRLPSLAREAGLEEPIETYSRDTLFGTFRLLEASRSRDGEPS